MMQRQDIEPLPELTTQERLAGEILIAQDRCRDDLRYLTEAERRYRRGYRDGLSRAMVLLVDITEEQDR